MYRTHNRVGAIIHSVLLIWLSCACAAQAKEPPVSAIVSGVSDRADDTYQATKQYPGSTEFQLSIPEGLSLIHIPLRVTHVDDQALNLDTVADVFDALGQDNVDSLTTYDGQQWLSYVGDASRRQSADRELTDDTGIIAVMSNAVTLRLRGEALGTDGTSTISLNEGTNLVGVPLKDERLGIVSDLLKLECLKDDISSIMVWDAGEFRVVAQPGDTGDTAITGGESFMVTASQESRAKITGEAWDTVTENSLELAPTTFRAAAKSSNSHASGIFIVEGHVVEAITGRPLDGLLVKVHNLTNQTVLYDTSGSNAESGDFAVTYVNFTNDAVAVSDLFEIHVSDPRDRLSTKVLRHALTSEDIVRRRLSVETVDMAVRPHKSVVLANYPNPFNPETWIPYQLSSRSEVTIRIYDVSGQLVRTLELGDKAAGYHVIRGEAAHWDGRNETGEKVSSGMYLYSFQTEQFRAIRRMLLVK